MKKVMMISLIPIFVFFLPLGIIGGSFFLTGCVEESSSRFDGAPVATGEEVALFSRSRFPYYNQMFGYPNTNDWLRFWQYLSDVTTTSTMQGYVVDDDKKSFAKMCGYFSDSMISAREEYALALEQNETTNCASMLDEQIEMLDIMSYTGVGDVINQLIYQMGRDWLSHHLFPMVEHYFTMPMDLYYEFVNAVEDSGAFTKLSEADFDTLMEVLRRMRDDKDETYGPIWDAMPSAWDMIGRVRDYGGDVTVKEGQDLLDFLLDIIQDPPIDITGIEIDGDENLAEALADAMDKVWDEGEIILTQELDGNGNLVDITNPEDYVTLTFQTELKKLLNSVGMLMSNPLPFDNVYDAANGWDNNGPMTDLARVLLSIQKLLDDDTLPRARLRAFLEALLSASAAMDKTSAMGDGADSINGALGTYYNPVYFAGLDYAVDYCFKHNQNNQLRDAGGEEIDVLRVLLFLLPVMDNPSLGGVLGPLMIFTPAPGVVSRANMMDFVAGEAATTSMNYDDPFDYLDYLLYQKQYNLVLFMNFNGFFDLLNTFRPMINFFAVLNPFGGMIDDMEASLDSAYVAMAQGSPGGVTQSGVYHQLTFFMQFIEHFYFMPYPGRASWDSGLHGWERELVDFAVSLNETESAAVFANDNGANGVLKTLGGAYGYGLATYALRNHNDPSQDGVFLDAVLYLLSMVVNELIDTTYNDPNYTYYEGTKYEGTLWAALMDYIKDHKLLGIDIDEDYDQWIPDAFDPDGNGDILLDTVEDPLTDFHDIIAIFAEDIGKVILAVTQDDTRYNRIMDDIDIIRDIVDKMAIDTDTGGIGAFSDLIAYFLKANEDGSDNKIVANLKASLIKSFDLKPGSESEIVQRHNLQSLDTESDEYKYYLDLYKNIEDHAAWWHKESNREIAFFDDDYVIREGIPKDFKGTLDNDASLSDLFKHAFGEDDDLEGGVYSLNHVRDFVDELLDSNVDLFGALEIFLSEAVVEHDVENPFGTWSTAFSMQAGILWENFISRRYFRYTGFQALDYDLDGETDPIAIFLFTRCLDLETDFNGVLDDSLLFWGGPPMMPGGVSWNVWEEVFRFQYEGQWLW